MTSEQEHVTKNRIGQQSNELSPLRSTIANEMVALFGGEHSPSDNPTNLRNTIAAEFTSSPTQEFISKDADKVIEDIIPALSNEEGHCQYRESCEGTNLGANLGAIRGAIRGANAHNPNRQYVYRASGSILV